MHKVRRSANKLSSASAIVAALASQTKQQLRRDMAQQRQDMLRQLQDIFDEKLIIAWFLN
jgi:hypothetical protein